MQASALDEADNGVYFVRSPDLGRQLLYRYPQEIYEGRD